MTARASHPKAHPTCPHAGWVACDKAYRERFGRCTELTQDKKKPTQCVRWGNSIVGERAMCDMHAGMVIERKEAAIRSAEKRERVNALTEAAIRAGGQEPHVCDKPLCRFIHRSPLHVCEPACTEWTTAPG